MIDFIWYKLYSCGRSLEACNPELSDLVHQDRLFGDVKFCLAKQ